MTRRQIFAALKKEAATSMPTLAMASHGRKHLVGIDGRNRGFFLVNNRNKVLDRKAFREIAEEAKEMGVDWPLFIWCCVASYTGHGMEIMQLSPSLLNG